MPTPENTAPDYLDLPLGEFLDRVASDSPAPGGGSVAAIAVALAAGLAGMAARLSTGQLSNAPELADQADASRQRVAPLASADAATVSADVRPEGRAHLTGRLLPFDPVARSDGSLRARYRLTHEDARRLVFGWVLAGRGCFAAAQRRVKRAQLAHEHRERVAIPDQLARDDDKRVVCVAEAPQAQQQERARAHQESPSGPEDALSTVGAGTVPRGSRASKRRTS